MARPLWRGRYGAAADEDLFVFNKIWSTSASFIYN